LKAAIGIVTIFILTTAGCGRNPDPANSPAGTPVTRTSTMSDERPIPTEAKPAAERKAELTAPTIEEVGDTSEVAVISTAKGDFTVEFFPAVAPLHVANFKKLARAGFYDGTTFHRVLPGFVIQGGDPNTKDSDPNNDGMGGPPWKVKAEFNDILHEKGILSMARSQDINSAGSQFFVCLGRTPHLDNKYTVFGKVIRGIETVDAIGAMKRDPSNPHDRTLPAVIIRSVKVVSRSALPQG